MSAVVTVQVTFTGRKEPVQLTAQSVSASFLDVLGVPPLLGRTFRPDEDLPNRNNVVLISYALWQNDFGGSQTVVGQRVTVDGFPATVIGVLPRDFEFLSNLPGCVAKTIRSVPKPTNVLYRWLSFSIRELAVLQNSVNESDRLQYIP